MRRATEERGSYIDQLGEQMNNASVSASNYLTQARNNAVSQGVYTNSGANFVVERIGQSECQRSVFQTFLIVTGSCCRLVYYLLFILYKYR
jgi:hypothetical protein